MSFFRLCAVLTLFALLGGLSAVCVAAEGEGIPVAGLASAPDAGSPSLSRGADGSVWLGWLDPEGEDTVNLRVAQYDASAQRWLAGHLVTRQAHWVANVFDAPQILALDARHAAAVWSLALTNDAGDVGSPRAFYSLTRDGGLTWSTPAPVSKDSDNVEYVRIAARPQGGFLAVWIDGRGRTGDSAAPKLYSGALDPDGPDTLIDGSVCDCCRPSLVTEASGSILLAYRSRSAAQIRDIAFARYQDGAWEPDRAVTGEGWKLDGCPVNGPALATEGDSQSAVWFTGAGDTKRIILGRLQSSPHLSVAAPLRVDLGSPEGRVDVVALPGGDRIVSWLESAQPAKKIAAGLYVRRIHADGTLDDPILVSDVVNDPVGRVFPKLALVSDLKGGPAIVLAAYVRPGSPAAIETRRVVIPD